MTPKEKSEQIQKRFKNRGYTNDAEIKEMSLIVARLFEKEIDAHLAYQNELNKI